MMILENPTIVITGTLRPLELDVLDPVFEEGPKKQWLYALQLPGEADEDKIGLISDMRWIMI